MKISLVFLKLLLISWKQTFKAYQNFDKLWIKQITSILLMYEQIY